MSEAMSQRQHTIAERRLSIGRVLGNLVYFLAPPGRQEIANNGHGAKLPENPANIALSGQKSTLINGWAA
jgi:hypothetical protein